MRIGIDCRTLLNPASEGGEKAGVGHYTTSLVQALIEQYPDDEFVLFVDERMPEDEYMRNLESYPHVTVVEFPGNRYKRFLPFIYSHVFLAWYISRFELDIFHAPAYIIPFFYRRCSLVTIHDVAIYSHPEWFPKQSSFSQNVLVPHSVRAASRVIAVSKSTAEAVQQLFSLSPEKISVTYEGVTDENTAAPKTSLTAKQVKEKFAITGPYVLFVGTREPRKNISRLIQAFDVYKQKHSASTDLQLIIAGAKGWRDNEIDEAYEHAFHKKDIRILGYISHAEKIALLKNCLFFAFPSLWEGFGLPVIEAQQLGVAVLTSNTSALPEVAGEGAVYIDPYRVQSIEEGIATLVQNVEKRKKIAEIGKKNAQQFSWERCAQETYTCYSQTINR